MWLTLSPIGQLDKYNFGQTSTESEDYVWDDILM